MPELTRSLLDKLSSGRWPTLPYEDASLDQLELKLDLGVFLISGRGKDRGTDRYWTGVWSVRGGRPLQLYEGNLYAVQAVALNPGFAPLDPRLPEATTRIATR